MAWPWVRVIGIFDFSSPLQVQPQGFSP